MNRLFFEIFAGETLTFKWEGPHNVEQLEKEDYENCTGFNTTEPTESPFEFVSEAEGSYYFACGVPTHCDQGQQKAEVTVKTDC